MPSVAHQSVIGDIYKAAAAPEEWPATLAALCDALGTSGGLVVMNSFTRRRGFLVGGRIRTDLTDLYLTRYTDNPVSRAVDARPFGEPILSNAVVDMATLARSAFHADILRPQDIAGMLVIKHASLTSNDAVGGISFNLGVRQLDNHSTVVRRLRPFVPHLMRALELSVDLGQRSGLESSVRLAIDAMPMPALLLDVQGRVAHLNVLADTLLRDADGLALQEADGIRLMATNRQDDRALARAVRRSLSIAAGEENEWSGMTAVSRPSGQPSLRVLTTPLPASVHPFAPAIPTHARVLVQIVAPGSVDRLQAALFRQAYGLTIAEARVATLIGSGLSVPATARALAVSVTTVKSHLGKCFDKAEVRSQAELARLLALMPARPMRLW